ncbi:MAG: hypothetical protein H6907_03010 [Hyphomicrobiales bacterium]|nr:hypothetical protein [Hyphomicrobiales bacterium]MCP5370676.1 hypothetical protein [Hyphomicrobiales bacterium]
MNAWRVLALAAALTMALAPAAPAGAGNAPPPLAPGLAVSEAAVDVAQVVGLARIGMARPDLIAPVRFEGPRALPQAKGDLIQGGFGLGAYTVLRDAPVQGQENVRLVSGLLTHRDLFGRGEWSSFTAGFVAEGDTVTIHRARVAPYYPRRPAVRFAFLPAAAAPAGLLDGAYTSVSLLRFLYEMAVPARDGLPAGDYVVFALFMDRLPPDAQVGLTAGRRPGGPGGDAEGKVVVAEDGWFAAALRARFDRGAGPAVFKALAVPPGGGAPEVAAVFATDGLVR